LAKNGLFQRFRAPARSRGGWFYINPSRRGPVPGRDGGRPRQAPWGQGEPRKGRGENPLLLPEERPPRLTGVSLTRSGLVKELCDYHGELQTISAD